MKLKKALSGILAAAMVVSLTPAMAFAQTTNSVSSVPTVAASEKMPETKVYLEVKDPVGWEVGTIEKFKLTLGNAEWVNKPDGASGDKIKAGANEIITAGASGSTTLQTGFVSASDNSLEMSLKVATDKLAKSGIVTLTVTAGAIKTGSEDGPVTIAIDGLDSDITGSTVTIGTVGSSNTVATTNGDVKTYTRTTTAVNTSIEIRETAVNSITGSQIIKMTLPKGVTWSKVGVSGDMLKDSAAGTVDCAAAGDYLATADMKEMVEASITKLKYDLGNEGRSLYLLVPVKNTDDVRQVLTIKPEISIGKSAVKGEIAVDITSYFAVSGNSVSDENDLVIASYGEESVTISTVDEKDLPVIYAGYKQNNKSKTKYIAIRFKENIKGALSEGRYIDIELPDEIEVLTSLSGTNNDIASPYGIKYSLDKNADLDDATSAKAVNEGLIEFESDNDSSEFSFMVPDTSSATLKYIGSGVEWDSSKAKTLTLFVPVTADSDFEGDINVKLTGAKAGIEDTELLVGTVKSPVTVETTLTEVKNGVQKQVVGDITITENEVGYLKTNTQIDLELDDFGLSNALVFDDCDVEVTSGDLEIKKRTISQGTISIPVKSDSTKLSTIKISNITATLNRTLPEGAYDLLVGGTALKDNAAYEGGEFAKSTPVTVEGYINIITPAESTTVSEKVDAKFVIGEASYTNNGAATEMDAAAYIDSHNRTMVPIRYVANACGISENDIRWEQNTQTAIINGLNTVVTVKMGSNKLQTSTGEITMDTVAVNNNGRIYVPVRYIANALGANVSWDAATKTVTLTK